MNTSEAKFAKIEKSLTHIKWMLGLVVIILLFIAIPTKEVTLKFGSSSEVELTPKQEAALERLNKIIGPRGSE